MDSSNLLYKREILLGKDGKIRISIPTVGDILRDEDNYYSLVQMLTAMPIDMMVPLDDAGMDFTDMDDYELFLILFNTIKSMDTRDIFVDLDLSKFRVAINDQHNALELVDIENDIVIDRNIHNEIADALRKIHHLEKNKRKPFNKEAKEFLIERARKKMKRSRNKQEDSQLESLIVAMVNTEQFKYGFEDVKNLTIYQFNESVRQIIKKVDYDNQMHGVYAGTISTKDLSQDDLNWLIHK